MLLFLSEYTNKVDKKGRVSVPASFRSQLESTDFKGFIAFPHLELPCIEGWARPRMMRLAAGMDDLPPLSAQYAANSTLMTKSKELTFDPEGRVMLIDVLRDYAGITDQAVFAGRGQTFQIWEPGRFKEFESQAVALIQANADNIRLAPPTPETRDV